MTVEERTMKIHHLTKNGCFTVATVLAALFMPAALLAVQGESQFWGELTKIEGDRYTVHG
jgi:hypothetical protein